VVIGHSQSGMLARLMVTDNGTRFWDAVTDTVVQYESAHLDGAASEKIVRSTHSIQSMPATIPEIRPILYEHLGIACGLECEVPERVEAAVASAPKPEPPAVNWNAVQSP